MLAAQSAIRTASKMSAEVTAIMILRRLIFVRVPQSGHFGTSWSKVIPQAGQFWRMCPGCAIDQKLADIRGRPLGRAAQVEESGESKDPTSLELPVM